MNFQTPKTGHSTNSGLKEQESAAPSWIERLSIASSPPRRSKMSATALVTSEPPSNCAPLSSSAKQLFRWQTSNRFHPPLLTAFAQAKTFFQSKASSSHRPSLNQRLSSLWQSPLSVKDFLLSETFFQSKTFFAQAKTFF